MVKYSSSSLDPLFLISNAKLVFWDFDGVIKDSVSSKTAAFEQLFSPFGSDVVSRIRHHHESNGGVSRFDKIPLYLAWAGEPATCEQVDLFCTDFSHLVLQAVVESPWVPGVREFLLNNQTFQLNVLVTATPQLEITEILTLLSIRHCFVDVFGSPTQKAKAISSTLERFSIDPMQAVMVGDSKTDLLASNANLVPFLLRRTPLNLSLQSAFPGPMFYDLTNE